ncbi:MAG: hypothetical protein AAFN70_05745, partial [Planctomycetota bacterium]
MDVPDGLRARDAELARHHARFSHGGLFPIAAWIRDSITGTDSTSRADGPYRWFRGSVGCVTWTGDRGLVHCRQNRDQHGPYRRVVDIEARDGRGLLRDIDSIGGAFFDSMRAARFATFGRAVSLPVSIVDGIITAVEQQSIESTIDTALRSGLDRPAGYIDQVDSQQWVDDASTRSLRQQIAELNVSIDRQWREIEPNETPAARRQRHCDALIARLQQHSADAWQRSDDWHRDVESRYHRDEQSRRNLHRRRAAWVARLRRMRDVAMRLDHQSAGLRRDIDTVNGDIHHVRQELRDAQQPLQTRHDASGVLPVGYHDRLATIDAQLLRLRRTLADIRQTHQWMVGRGSLESALNTPLDWADHQLPLAFQQGELEDADLHYGPDHAPIRDTEVYDYREDDAYEVDLDADSEIDVYQRAYTPSRSTSRPMRDDAYGVSQLETRLENAYRQLDDLTKRYDQLVAWDPWRDATRPHSSVELDWGWDQESLEELLGTIQSLKTEIREVTDHLAAVSLHSSERYERHRENLHRVNQRREEMRYRRQRRGTDTHATYLHDGHPAYRDVNYDLDVAAELDDLQHTDNDVYDAAYADDDVYMNPASHGLGRAALPSHWERLDTANHPLRRCQRALLTAIGMLMRHRQALLRHLASLTPYDLSDLQSTLGDWTSNPVSPRSALDDPLLDNLDASMTIDQLDRWLGADSRWTVGSFLPRATD